MQIENIMGNFEDIFNPKVTYDGYFVISSYDFIVSSKYSKGLNLVREELYKQYLSYIYPNHQNFIDSVNISLLFYSSSKNGYGREFTPASDLFIKDYISSLFKTSLKEPENLEIIAEDNKNFLREILKNIKAILNEKMNLEDNSILFNAYLKSKNLVIKNLKDQSNNSKSIREKLTINSILSNEKNLKFYILSRLKEQATSILLHYDNIVKRMNKPLDMSKFNNLFDYDTLYLRLAKVFLNTSRDSLKEGHELPTVVLFLYKYYNALKVLKNYHFVIDASDILYDDEKRKKYSTRDFIRDFERFILPIEDPEIRYYQIMEKENDIDYYDLNNVYKKLEYLKALEDARIIAAEWDFIPKGENITPRIQSLGSRQHRTSKELSEEREKRLEKVLQRLQFLDNTPYIYKSIGKNKFDGYIAYMYSNGYIIFEKFYENQDTLNPSKNNATYVMNIDNFVEMSKLSKPEIIKYIKAGNTDVMRKNHTSSWEANMLSIINSSFYSKELIEKIDRLISLGKIENKELVKTL